MSEPNALAMKRGPHNNPTAGVMAATMRAKAKTHDSPDFQDLAWKESIGAAEPFPIPEALGLEIRR